MPKPFPKLPPDSEPVIREYGIPKWAAIGFMIALPFLAAALFYKAYMSHLAGG